MFTNPPSLEQLHKGSLDCLRSLAQVIKKGDHGLGGFAKLLKCPKGNPLRRGRIPRDNHAEPTEISGLMNCRMAVYQLNIEAAGHCLNYFGLPDTGRSDKEKGPAGLDRVFY
jgi:hypothetical protein